MNHFDRIFFSKYIKEGEELLYVCHKHIIMIIDTIVVWMFFGVLLPCFFYYNNSFSLIELVPFFYFKLYLFGIYLFLLYRIFDWYNDVWLITDHGLVDIDWRLFAENIVYIDYHDVRGVEINKSSIFDALLGKGNLIIHLDSEDGEFMLEGASDPQEIVEYIQGVVDEMHHHGEEEDENKEPMDLLIETLTSMVREHLEGKSVKSHEEEEQEEEILEKALNKKGTIDLR